MISDTRHRSEIDLGLVLEPFLREWLQLVVLVVSPINL